MKNLMVRLLSACALLLPLVMAPLASQTQTPTYHFSPVTQYDITLTPPYPHPTLPHSRHTPAFSDATISVRRRSI